MRAILSTITASLLATVVVAAQQPATKKAASTAAASPAKVTAPAPIASAFSKAYPNARITNVAREKENGQDVYEVESVNDGLGLDLIFRPDGTIVETEEEISSANLPPAVAGAITKRYPKAVVTKREKVTRGTSVSYEMVLKGAGVTAVELRPDGAWVSPKLATASTPKSQSPK